MKGDYPMPEGERIITTAPMSLERAREVLNEAGFELRPGHAVRYGMPYAEWPESAFAPHQAATLNGSFTADQLEALAVWMRAHSKEGG